MELWTRCHTIGRGSTATVSLATSLQSGDVFAVKSSEISQSQFLQREQTILSSIVSPYIVGYKGCDVTIENNKAMYNLFLEHMSGGSLIDKIQAHGGCLEESMIVYYTYQIVQGLNYLHSNGLVHCDIKSSNILTADGGVAKIADFGCAKRAVVDTVETAETIGGTPMFMAPEVARGEEQGFASDIWALGCTIIEMASGRVPWPSANDPVSVIYQIGFMDHLPEFPSCISQQGNDFLEKCLRRDPKQRWTATQLLNHPFLRKFKSHRNQIQESNHSNSSFSPTSILDQGIWNWNSLDDHESLLSASERIRRLSLISEGPIWEFDGDENWIPVRGRKEDIIMEEIEGKDGMSSYGSLYKENKQLLKALWDNNSGSRLVKDIISSDCEFEKDSFLVCSSLELDRGNGVFLISYVPKFILQT